MGHCKHSLSQHMDHLWIQFWKAITLQKYLSISSIFIDLWSKGRSNLFQEERCYWNANLLGNLSQGLFNDEKLDLSLLHCPMHASNSWITLYRLEYSPFCQYKHLGAMELIHKCSSFWKQSQNSRGIFASFGTILTGKQTRVSRYNWGLIALLDSLYSIYPIMWITLEST